MQCYYNASDSLFEVLSFVVRLLSEMFLNFKSHHR